VAYQWRGVIREYADRLPSLDGMPVVTLLEGGTPLIPAEHLSSLVEAEVWLKFEGLNPTGSFKDRGMTTAISVAAGTAPRRSSARRPATPARRPRRMRPRPA
jgi:threonine synthase